MTPNSTKQFKKEKLKTNVHMHVHYIKYQQTKLSSRLKHSLGWSKVFFQECKTGLISGNVLILLYTKY